LKQFRNCFETDSGDAQETMQLEFRDQE